MPQTQGTEPLERLEIQGAAPLETLETPGVEPLERLETPGEEPLGWQGAKPYKEQRLGPRVVQLPVPAAERLNPAANMASSHCRMPLTSSRSGTGA